MMHQKDSCSCYKSGLCIDGRHLSWIMASLVILFFLFFVSGYFVGKRQALQDMHDSVVQESFADKIYASLCTMQGGSCYRTAYQECVAEENEDNGQSADDCSNHMASNDDRDVVERQQPPSQIQLPVDKVDTKPVHYYAQLVGFGTQEAAQQFCDRLRGQLQVLVKEHNSRTAKGKKITWYQVVTEQFQDKQKLEAMIKKVQLKERLRDVRIVTC